MVGHSIALHHHGDVIGALSVVASPASAFDEVDVAALGSTANFVAALISAHTEIAPLLDELLSGQKEGRSPNARFAASLLLPWDERDDRLDELLDTVIDGPGCMTAVFQPIVDLRSQRVLGFEGLSRFPHDSGMDPSQWFAGARRVGRRLDLEMAALRNILAAAGQLPESLFLTVNLSPLVALEAVAHEVLQAFECPVVLELTEHEPFPANLAAGLASLRTTGFRIAVDDAGAGYSSFTQLLRLQPDIIKIDGELTVGIDDDPAKQALVSAMVRLAGEIGAVTIAEQIETRGQLRVLQDLGIHQGQGFLFGRPEAACAFRGTGAAQQCDGTRHHGVA